MSKEWRPGNWVKERNTYFEQNQPQKPYYKTRQRDYEAGADAMLEALFKLASESSTGTFVIDSKAVNIYGDNNESKNNA